MKSQRRHELEHNELARWLIDTFTTAQPYQNIILGAAIAVLVGVLGYLWWSRQTQGQAAEAWDQFYQAQASRNPVGFEKLAEQYRGTPVAPCSDLMAADLRLAEGCQQLFVNKASANQELRKAVALYTDALQQAEQPMLRERATFGLARAYDALGETDKAADYYKQVVDNWPDGTYHIVAARQAADLQKTSTKQWYDRFAKYDPKPAYTDVPGKTPNFNLDSLPDGPLFKPKMDLKEEKGASGEQPKQAPAKAK